MNFYIEAMSAASAESLCATELLGPQYCSCLGTKQGSLRPVSTKLASSGAYNLLFCCCAGRPALLSRSVQVRAASKQSKLDVLKQENEALRAALESVDATDSVDEIENRLRVTDLPARVDATCKEQDVWKLTANRVWQHQAESTTRPSCA